MPLAISLQGVSFSHSDKSVNFSQIAVSFMKPLSNLGYMRPMIYEASRCLCVQYKSLEKIQKHFQYFLGKWT